MARGDGGCGVHKHHLKEEQGEDADIIDPDRQEEPCSHDAEVLANKWITLRCQIGAHTRATPARYPRTSGQNHDPEAQHTDGVNHHVHEHGVGRVLAAEAGLHHGETRLHEHD